MTPEAADAEIQRLQSYRHREAGGNDPNEAYGWERARAARDRQGSYLELERALEVIDPFSRAFLAWIYDSGLDVKRSKQSYIDEDKILGHISMLMPSKIRLPRHLHAELMERKRKRARALLRDGLDSVSVSIAVLLPQRLVEALK